jgi:hypothetical protein
MQSHKITAKRSTLNLHSVFFEAPHLMVADCWNGPWLNLHTIRQAMTECLIPGSLEMADAAGIPELLPGQETGEKVAF